MNKKGFTLIELLAVAVILSLMILSVVPNLLETFNQVKQKEKDLFIARLLEAAKVYAENHKHDIESFKKINGVAYITLRDIVDSGLLKTPIIDPADNKEIPLTTLIKITRIANNKFEVVYNAFIPPIIEITGDNPTNIARGTSYTDQGATATSHYDGNITSLIQTTINVNTSIVGTHFVKYTVTDSKGSTISVTRTVKVE